MQLLCSRLWLISDLNYKIRKTRALNTRHRETVCHVELRLDLIGATGYAINSVHIIRRKPCT